MIRPNNVIALILILQIVLISIVLWFLLRGQSRALSNLTGYDEESLSSRSTAAAPGLRGRNGHPGPPPPPPPPPAAPPAAGPPNILGRPPGRDRRNQRLGLAAAPDINVVREV